VGYGVWDYGHVCIWVPGMGLFSSPKHWDDPVGSSWFYSIDEVSNWIGGTYLGWTSDINGMQIARWVEDGVPTPAPVPQPSWGGTYTVQPGDSLSAIADQYGITWQDLYAANAGLIGPNPDYIEVGWVLTVPGTAAPAPEPTPEPTVTPDATVDVTPTPEPQPEPIPEPETPMPETPALSQADRDKMMAKQAELVAKIQPTDLGNIITNPVARKVTWAIYGLTGLFIVGIMGGLTAAGWLAPEWFIFATGAYTAISPAFASLAVANIKS
jgi:LysM repeat protein